uniref:Uncharacterized protein n=1 Tax=Mycena chlorophos TaxID=658473 RepID=A0ABQ0L4J7_MYCCL|nr:predicted protein [Mycena chlorophos]
MLLMAAPIIVCGGRESIGRVVVENLKPEIETIHFILTPEAGKVQIPTILRGDPDPSTLSSSDLGTKNYSRKPIAVIVGGAFDDADVAAIMDAARGIHPVPWLKADKSVPMPPVGSEYAVATARRIKERLAGLERDGELKVEEDRIILF